MIIIIKKLLDIFEFRKADVNFSFPPSLSLSLSHTLARSPHLVLSPTLLGEKPAWPSSMLSD